MANLLNGLSGIEEWLASELGETPSFKGRYFLDTYSALLGKELGTIERIVEIGIAEGASLLAWARLCPRATIFGFDIRLPPAFPAVLARNVLADRVHLIVADQNDPGLIVVKIPDGIDLIVDDGCHLLEPTRRCFFTLFRKLRPGGWYAIEDWGAGYWESHGGPANGMHLLLSEIIDNVGLIDRSRAEAGKYRVEGGDRLPIAEIRVLPAIALIRRGKDSNV